MEYKLTSIQPSPVDPRDRLVTALPTSTLPPHIDLLPDVTEVENQYQTGSCTANAAASALEIAYKRAGQVKDFSRLFIYWFSRKLGGITNDTGAYPRDMCKALQQNGTCLEPTWDFDVSKVNVEPSSTAVDEAKQYPVHEYARLEGPDIIDQIKQSVAAGIPVLTTVKLSKAFYALGPDWKQHDWDPQIDSIGSHEVVIIGYDDVAERFLAQNSWGAYWGDGGFFGIPYNRIGLDYYTPNTSGYEYWILSKLPVPYFNASGKETEPLNVVEKESAERAAKNKKYKILLAVAIVGVVLFQAYQLGLFK